MQVMNVPVEVQGDQPILSLLNIIVFYYPRISYFLFSGSNLKSMHDVSTKFMCAFSLILTEFQKSSIL